MTTEFTYLQLLFYADADGYDPKIGKFFRVTAESKHMFDDSFRVVSNSRLVQCLVTQFTATNLGTDCFLSRTFLMSLMTCVWSGRPAIVLMYILVVHVGGF